MNPEIALLHNMFRTLEKKVEELEKSNKILEQKLGDTNEKVFKLYCSLDDIASNLKADDSRMENILYKMKKDFL